MAKDNQRQIAQGLYIDHCFTAKDIAQKLDVSEKTVSQWVNKGNWRELRLSKQTTTDVMLGKYNELLNALLDKRLLYEKKQDKTDDDKHEYNGVIDEMSKVSAMIDKIQKDGRPSLRIHIMCVEKFMGALHQNKPKLYMDLIDFQRDYFTLLADELK